MSNVIDRNDYIVSMEFDNSRFESNVETSMKTIDKLKNKLDFKDTANSLTGLEKAAGKIDLGPIGKALDSIHDKFNALHMIGYSAINRMTNAAIDSGERLIKSVSTDQISKGWTKLESKTKSVQTLVNSTGKTVDEIDDYLSQLMWFSDETSYSFTEMVDSLASMTSSGGNIDNLIPTIMGIANATAYAGKGASEFSRVIYNLNQSYGQGFLSAMDWKSVQLAGVNSKALMEVLIEEGRKAGTITDEMDVSVSNFASTLKDKWATSDVMEKSFGRLAEFSMAVKDTVDSFAAEGKYITAADAIEMLKDKYDELTVKMFTSAQEAKSFSEAIEATKDAVSSGWMQTFDLIFGNYEETKEFWTDITNSLWDIFASGSEARNEMLSDIMTNNGALDTLKKTLKATGHDMGDFEKTLRKTLGEHNWIHAKELDDLISQYGSLEAVITKVGLPVKWLRDAFDALVGTEGEVSTVTGDAVATLEHMQQLVTSVIRGDYGNGQDRVNALTAAGESYVLTQDLVNKVYKKTNGTWSDCTITAEDLADSIAKLSDEEKKNIGFTENQIKTIDELVAASSDGKLSLDDMFAAMSKPTGRSLLKGSITNIMEAISNFITLVKRVKTEVFGTLDSGLIYNVISSINAFTKALILDIPDAEGEFTGKTKEVADVLRTLFEIVHIIGSVFSTVFKLAIHIGKQFLSIFTVFSPTADKASSAIKDLVHKFHEWLITSGRLEKAFDWAKGMVTTFTLLIKRFITFVKEFKPLMQIVNIGKSALSKVVSSLTTLFESLKGLSFKDSISVIVEFISSLVGELLSHAGEIAGALLDIGGNLLQGLINGMDEWLPKLWEFITTVGNGIITMFMNLFGIHSPSLVMMALGGFLIAGLIKGLLQKIPGLWGTTDDLGAEGESKVKIIFENLGEKIVDGLGYIKDGFTVVKNWITENAPGIWNWIQEALGFVPMTLGSVGAFSVASSFSKFLTNLQLGETLKSFTQGLVAPATGLGSLLSKTGSGIQEMLSGIGQLQKAVGARLKMKGFKDIGIGVLLIAGAIAVLTGSLLLLTKIDSGEITKALDALGKMVVMIGVLIDTILLIQKIGSSSGNALGSNNSLLNTKGTFSASSSVNIGTYNKTSNSIFGTIFGVALLILACAKALKMISGIEKADLDRGMLTLAEIFGLIIGFVGGMRLTMIGLKDTKGFKNIGSMLLKMVIALGLFALVIKLISKLKPEEIASGMAFLRQFAIFVVILLLAASLVGGDTMKYFGKTMVKLTIALLAMLLVCKLAGKLNPHDISNGYAVAGILVGMMLVLAIVGKIAGKADLKSIGGAVLKIAFSLLILAGALWLLSKIPAEELTKAINGMIVMIFAILAMILVLSFMPESKIKGVTGTLLAVVALFFVMTILMYVVQLLTMDQIKKGLLALAGMAGIVIALLVGVGLMGKLSGGNVGKATGALVMCAILLAELVALIWLMKSMDEKVLWRLTAVFAILVGALALLLLAASLTSAKNIAPLVGVIIILGMIGAGLYFMSKNMSAQDLTKAEKLAKLIAGVMLVVIATIIILSIIANIMRKIKTKDLLKGFANLSIAFGAFVVLLGAIGVLGLVADYLHADTHISRFVDVLKILSTNIDAILVMIGMVAVLAYGAQMLSGINTKVLLKGFGNLGIAFGAFAVLLAALTFLGWIAGGKADAVTNLQNFMDVMHVLATNIVELGLTIALIAAIAGGMVLLDGINVGKFAKGAANFGIAFGSLIVMLGVMALAGLGSGAWGGPEKLQSFMDLMRVISDNIDVFIVTFGATYLIAIAAASLAGIPVGLFALGVANFEIAVAGLIVMAAAFAGIGELILLIDKENNGQGVIDAMNKFGDFMYAFGEAIGKIIAGFFSGVFYNMSLEKIAADIKSFMNEMQDPLDKIKAIDEGYAKGAGNLVAVFGALLVGDIVAFVEKLLGIKQEDLKTSMTSLGAAVAAFMEEMKNVDATQLSSKAKAAADLVETLNSVDFNNGFWGYGDVDMDEVKTSMTQLAQGIVGFMTEINGSADLFNSDIDWDAVTTFGQHIVDMMNSISTYDTSIDIASFGVSVNKYINTLVAALKKLNENSSLLADTTNVDNAVRIGRKFVEFANTIPKTGGLLQSIIGESQIDDFGKRVEKYVDAIAAAGKTISENTAAFSMEETAYQAAVDIGAVFRDFQKSLPTTGGVKQDWLGESQIDDFGRRVEAYIGAMALAGLTLSQNAVLFKEGNITRFARAAEAGESFLTLANSIPPTSWWDEHFGKTTDIAGFGKDISDFLTEIVTAAGSLSGVDLSPLTSKLPDIQSIFDTFTSESVEGMLFDTIAFEPAAFMENMGYIASGLTTLVNETADISSEQLQVALDKLTQVVTFLDTMYADAQTFNSFAEAFKSLAETGLDGFTNALTGNDGKIDSAITGLISNLNSAVISHTSDIQGVAKDMCDIFRNAIAGYNDLESAARSLINRFIAGLRGSMPAANAAMLRMNKNVIDVTKRTLQEKSPSKVFEEIGQYVDLGFIKGIVGYSDKVNNTMTTLSEDAVNEFGNIMTQIQEGIDQNIEYDPTITPVVDLTNLENAAGTIGGYFDSPTMPIGAIGDVGIIGGNFMNQNGKNYDVVSALDKLGNDIVSNTSGDSYVINGVTYEEGSDVAEALETIAHAAVINGRR